MLKQFLMRHYNLVELNDEEKAALINHYNQYTKFGEILAGERCTIFPYKITCRLRELRIPFKYSKNEGIEPLK